MNACAKILIVVFCLSQSLFSFNADNSISYNDISCFTVEGSQKGMDLTINYLKGEFTIDSNEINGEISYILEGNDLYVYFSGLAGNTANTCLRGDVLYFEVIGSGTFDVLDYEKNPLFKGKGDFSISGGLRNVIVSQDNGKISITRK